MVVYFFFTGLFPSKGPSINLASTTLTAFLHLQGGSTAGYTFCKWQGLISFLENGRADTFFCCMQTCAPCCGEHLGQHKPTGQQFGQCCPRQNNPMQEHEAHRPRSFLAYRLPFSITSVFPSDCLPFWQ